MIDFTPIDEGIKGSLPKDRKAQYLKFGRTYLFLDY
jgi:hypothetical protein